METISEKAVLVKLTISDWLAIKTDTFVTKEVMNSHQANPFMGNFRKKLLKSPYHDSYRTVCRQAQARHYDLTLPWKDDGLRILPAKLFYDYVAEFNVFKEKATAAVNEFLSHYADDIERAKTELGTMFDKNDYPSAETLLDKFGIDFSFYPVPKANDWRIEIDEKEIEDLKKNLEKEMLDAQKSSTDELWNRLTEQVTQIHEKLTDPNKRLRYDRLESFKRFIELVPKLNISSNEEINNIVTEVGKIFSQTDVLDLREDESLKQKTINETQAILDKLSKYSNPNA